MQARTGLTAKRLTPAVLAATAALLAACGDGADRDAIRISGNIELTEVKVAFKVSGKLAERTVDEGDRVEAGQVIARLDQEPILRQKEQAEAALAAARSGLQQLLTAIEFQEASIEGQIAQRQAQLEQALARLAELEAGSRKQEIAQARARVERARSEFDRAKADWDRAQPLMKAEDISRAQYDQFRARYEAAKAQLEEAEQWLALVEEGPREETIEQARAAVQQAEAALRLAEAQRIELRRRRQEVDARKAEIRRAEAQVGYLETQLADTVATAPVGGIVLSKAAEVGEVLAAGTTVVTIGDLDHPWVRGYINETDLGRVKIGAPVRVTTDTFPGKVYQGRVTFIASEAEFTPKQIQTQEERVKLVYRIKIDVENPNQELKLNMPVDGEIVLE
ncbi:MAG TPA: HlyD family efflux transporter periplasmic adaptor subunit [Bryobacterales bacterium]|nr:HlyD family efflux transporter periplasmic adaptor subunit [Bryobacterales bacterium]